MPEAAENARSVETLARLEGERRVVVGEIQSQIEALGALTGWGPDKVADNLEILGRAVADPTSIEDLEARQRSLSLISGLSACVDSTFSRRLTAMLFAEIERDQ